MSENIEKTEKDYIKEQIVLAKQIVLKNTINLNQVRTVAGVDLAYWKKNETEYAVCCIVIIDYHTLEIIEEVCYKDIITVPYIPGCLAFREVPIFLETYKMLKTVPDVLFFDGNGYFHPRHMGLATHAGILIQKATVATVYKGIHIKNKIMDCQPTEKPLFHNEGRFFHGRRERRQPNYRGLTREVKPFFHSRKPRRRYCEWPMKNRKT